MRNAIYIAAIVLAILHKDFWLWDDTTLVFGFIPSGLFFHMLFSTACVILWSLAVVYAWPDTVEEEVKEHLEEVKSEEAPST